MHESLNDLTGESASNGTCLFVNNTYLAVENQYQSGTRLETEETAEYVTTESLAGLCNEAYIYILYLFIYNLTLYRYPRPYIHPKTMPDPTGIIYRIYWRLTSRFLFYIDAFKH